MNKRDVEKVEKELAHEKEKYERSCEDRTNLMHERDVLNAEVAQLTKFKPNTCETCENKDICVEDEPVVFYKDCNIKIHDKWEPTDWFTKINDLDAEVARLKARTETIIDCTGCGFLYGCDTCEIVKNNTEVTEAPQTRPGDKLAATPPLTVIEYTTIAGGIEGDISTPHERVNPEYVEFLQAEVARLTKLIDDKNMSIEFKHGTCETCDYHVTPGHDIVCRRCKRHENTFLHDEDHYKPTDWYCRIVRLEVDNSRLTKQFDELTKHCWNYLQKHPQMETAKENIPGDELYDHTSTKNTDI